MQLSHSSVNSYLQCPRYYKLSKVDGLKGITKKAFFEGRAYESAVVDGYNGDFNFEKSYKKEMDKDFDSLTEEEKKETEDNLKESVEKGQKCVEIYHEGIGKRYELIETQIKLDGILCGFIEWVGYADAVLKNKDQETSLLVDFKTSSRSMNEISFDYKRQLALYSTILENMETGIHALIKTKTPKTQELIEDLSRYNRVVEETFFNVYDNIKQANFSPLGLSKIDLYTRKPQCFGCLQRNNCDSFYDAYINEGILN